MKFSNGLRYAKYGFVSGGFILLLGISLDNAEGKQRKRTKRVSTHGHSHGHEHGREETSPWILGAGVSISKGLGSSSSSSEEGESGGDHSGHTHLTSSDDHFALDEGHSHDEGGEAGSEEGGSSIEPTFSALVGYRISKKIAANLGLSLGTSSGIGDPLIGLDYKLRKIGKIKSSVIPSFTVPLSKASKDSYKITTFSATWNPSFKSGKILYSGSTGLAKSYYSKTVIVEEDPHEAIPSRPIFAMTQEEHGHDDNEIEEEGESLTTGDREFDRYSLNTSAGYPYSKNILTGCGLGVAMVTKQFGPSQIETSATLLKVTYLWKSIAATLSLGLSESQESFSIPKNPNVSLGVFYSYE